MRLLLSILITLFCVNAQYNGMHSKVLLHHVKTLTLNKNEYTKYRRTASILQLNCVGGSARSESDKVEVVQCINTGFNGKDYSWKCKSYLPKNLRLGKLSISCEGFDYADDPYVLVGSCGLDYNLEYVTLHRPQPQPIPYTNNQHQTPYKQKPDQTQPTQQTQTHTIHQTHNTYQARTKTDTLEWWANVLATGFLIGCLVYWVCGCVRHISSQENNNRRRIPTQTYTEYDNSSRTYAEYVNPSPNVIVVPQQSYSHSFTDGMLFGSALSNAYQRTPSTISTTYIQTTPQYSHTPTHDNHYDNSDDGNSHTSTSFGDTKRR